MAGSLASMGEPGGAVSQPEALGQTLRTTEAMFGAGVEDPTVSLPAIGWLYSIVVVMYWLHN